MLAAFCDIATNGDPALTAFRQQIDGLNAFIAFNALPSDMARRMRLYMHQQQGMQLREALGKRALPNLSLPLQLEAMLHIHRAWLDAVWFIRELEAPVKVRLAMEMQPRVMSPGEVAPNRHMHSLTRGTMIYGGRILSRGAVWGDDVLLNDPRNFLPYTARAITFADCSSLPREALMSIVQAYPRSHARLRKRAAFLALRRWVISTAKRAVEDFRANGRKRLSVTITKDGHIRLDGDFLDRVDSASESNLSESQQQSMELALAITETGSFRHRRLQHERRGESTAEGVEDAGTASAAEENCERVPGAATALSSERAQASLNTVLRQLTDGMARLQADVSRIGAKQDELSMQLNKHTYVQTESIQQLRHKVQTIAESIRYLSM